MRRLALDWNSAPACCILRKAALPFHFKDGLPDDMICQFSMTGRQLMDGSHHGICASAKSLRAFVSARLPAFHVRSMTVRRLPPCNVRLVSPRPGVGMMASFGSPRTKALSRSTGRSAGQLETTAGRHRRILGERRNPGTPPGNNSGAENLKYRLENKFKFNYTALSLTDADKIHFRYKLEGFDSDWLTPARALVQYNY